VSAADAAPPSPPYHSSTRARPAAEPRVAAFPLECPRRGPRRASKRSSGKTPGRKDSAVASLPRRVMRCTDRGGARARACGSAPTTLVARPASAVGDGEHSKQGRALELHHSEWEPSQRDGTDGLAADHTHGGPGLGCLARSIQRHREGVEKRATHAGGALVVVELALCFALGGGVKARGLTSHRRRPTRDGAVRRPLHRSASARRAPVRP